MKWKIALLSLLIFVTSCSRDKGDSISQVEQQVHVDTLEIVNVIGTEFGDSTNTFCRIMDVDFEREGNILVLDGITCDLRIFDQDGQYVKHVTRSGNGPGELVFPWDFFLFPSGRLMILDPAKRGYIVFDNDYNFLQELQLWQQQKPFQGCAISDSQFVAFEFNINTSETDVTVNRRVVLYTYGNQEHDGILWLDSLIMSRNDVREDPSLIYTIVEKPVALCSDGNGTVYFALKSSDEYSVLGWDLDGQLTFEVNLDLQPVRKSEDEMLTEQVYVTNVCRRGGEVRADWEFQPSPFKNLIIDISIGPEGNLWVRRGTSLFPMFDIFDTENAELVGQAVFPEEGYTWMFAVTQYGIAAWEDDPDDYYQVLYQLEYSHEPTSI